jgi:glycosyltransferase involved in cell wall biosynthesis
LDTPTATLRPVVARSRLKQRFHSQLTNEPMRITHVCPTVEREANGLSKAVLDMALSLDAFGVDVELYTTGGAPPRPMGTVCVHRYRHWRLPARLLVAPRLRKALLASAVRSQLIHSHGLWTLPQTYALQAALSARVPSVVTAHGAFNAWPMSQSRWGKRIMWSLVQSQLFRQATCLHATAEAEVPAYRKMGLSSPIAVIPLGIDVPDTLPDRSAATPRKLLFLGRLHPKKGIDLLLQAWKDVEPRTTDWELHIVGPGDAAYVAKLRNMAAELNCQRVRFRGAVYGAEKSLELRSAEAFVLPTYDENFGLAVAEALAHGVPALVTRGAPWGGLNSRNCGWWVDIDSRAIAEALKDLTSRAAPELNRMGAVGRQWMRDEFSMLAMGRKLRELYAWILGGGSPPEFMHPHN